MDDMYKITDTRSSMNGYTNLTKVISEHGTNINWYELDGRKAKCVHPELGTLSYKLKRDTSMVPSSFSGWYKFDGSTSRTWVEALKQAWDNIDDWSLWVEGDVTLNLPIAGSLVPGTIFKGQEAYSSETKEFVIIIGENGEHQALERYSTRDFIEDLDSIGVIEVISGRSVDE